jgi:hypothetical protein
MLGGERWRGRKLAEEYRAVLLVDSLLCVAEAKVNGSLSGPAPPAEFLDAKTD